MTSHPPSDCLVASVYEPLAAQCLLILFTSSKLYCIANLTGNQKNFSHLTKLGVDLGVNDRHNKRCCFNVRRYLSWIEGLTTNQYVGGSNPSRRTILTAPLDNVRRYLSWIEGLTTNQYVGGSNPSRRTIFKL